VLFTANSATAENSVPRDTVSAVVLVL